MRPNQFAFAFVFALAAALLLANGCTPEVKVDDRPVLQEQVYFEPEAPADAVAEVLRIVAAGQQPDRLLLFEGELSSYHEGRLRRGDLPKTLTERIVPATTYVNDVGAVLSPVHPLAPSGRYTVGVMGAGSLTRIQVRPGGPPLLTRHWPGPEMPVDGGVCVYCSYSPVVPPGFTAEAVLQPGDVIGEVRAGAGDSSVLPRHCVTLRFSAADGATLLPPPDVFGLVLDPQPLVVASAPPPPRLPCPDSWHALTVGCLQVQDDRVVYRSTGGPAALALESGPVAAVVAVEIGEDAVIRGFAPSTLAQLALFEVSGPTHAAQLLSVETQPARAHPIINEVLANPVGPEPQQEWVELYNDGLGTWQLEGAVLLDAGGATALPSAQLPAGAFAILVNDAFQVASPPDLPPAPSALILRVEALGKNGLSNAGEPLSLLDADGQLLSSFPALKHAKAGVSAALRPGAVPPAFGMSAEPGATPGAVNVLPD